MVGERRISKIRKAHRYRCIFPGIPVLMGTMRGMYFSGTGIDKVHGDQVGQTVERTTVMNWIGPSELKTDVGLATLELR